MLFRVIGGKLHPAFAESVRLMRRMVAPVPALSCCHPALCSCAQPSLRPSLDSNAVSSSLSNDVHEEVGLVLLAGSPPLASAAAIPRTRSRINKRTYIYLMLTRPGLGTSAVELFPSGSSY